MPDLCGTEEELVEEVEVNDRVDKEEEETTVWTNNRDSRFIEQIYRHKGESIGDICLLVFFTIH